MRQALEIAIDYMNERLEDHDFKYKRHPATEAERINILADIETIKEALAQPEHDPYDEVFIAYGLPKPKQEPNSVTYKEVADAMNALYRGDSKQVQMAMMMESKKLYTTPPQRTWVGLTDEEAHELWESTDSDDDWELMKRTEAKLKEKNNA